MLKKMAMCLNNVNGATKIGVYSEKINQTKALYYYNIAILFEDSCAAHNIGNYYYVDVKDYDLALKYYLLALEYNKYSSPEEIFSTYKQIISIYKRKSNLIFLDYYQKCTKLGHISLISEYVKYLYREKAYGDMLFVSQYAINLANKRKKDIVGISDICNIVSKYYFKKESYVKDLYYRLLAIKYNSYRRNAEKTKDLTIRRFTQSCYFSVRTDLTKKFSKYTSSNKYSPIIKYLITCYNLSGHNSFTYTGNPVTYIDDLCDLDPNGKYALIKRSSIKKFAKYYMKNSDAKIYCFVDKWIDYEICIFTKFVNRCNDYDFILKHKSYLSDEVVKRLDCFAKLYPSLTSDIIECPICFEDKVLAMTNCRHQICLCCLYKLVTCPFCRSELV